MKKPDEHYNVDLESLAWGALGKSLQAQEKKMFEDLVKDKTPPNPKNPFKKPVTAPSEPQYITSVEQFDQVFGTPKPPTSLAVPPGIYQALEKIGKSSEAVVKTADVVAQLKKAISQLGSETVIRTMVHEQGRRLNGDSEIKRILDYMYRRSLPVYAEHEQKDIEAGSIDELTDRLEQLPGVKTTIINDSYPESASIIIKVDYRALDDDELNGISGRILETIANHKPIGLDELEVIYHNKEVY